MVELKSTAPPFVYCTFTSTSCHRTGGQARVGPGVWEGRVVNAAAGGVGGAFGCQPSYYGRRLQRLDEDPRVRAGVHAHEEACHRQAVRCATRRYDNRQMRRWQGFESRGGPKSRLRPCHTLPCASCATVDEQNPMSSYIMLYTLRQARNTQARSGVSAALGDYYWWW